MSSPIGGSSSLELVKYLADDLDVVNAAKVSFVKESTEIGSSEDGLIGYLLRNHHGSPFEHNYFQFRVRAPISVAREWVRHRIGIAWNEESGRYVKLRDDFYIPFDDAIRTQEGKPGAYKYVPITDAKDLAHINFIMRTAYQDAWEAYEELLEMGLAKEVARNVLPVGLYTEWIWSCNARSLMAFLTLRNAPDAMYEIRAYAAEMENLFAEVMPITAKWFREVSN